MARSLIAEDAAAPAEALAAAFWPGPLTIVARARGGVPRRLLGASSGIGLRCSSDPWASALLAAFARPITATSANPSGAAPAGDVAGARQYFADRVAYYLDGGSRSAQTPSSVVEFFRGAAYLRRSGSIGREALAAVVPNLSMES